MQAIEEISGDIASDGHSASPQSAAQLHSRRTASRTTLFRSEKAGPRRDSVAAKVDQFSVCVAERACRGGSLTVIERGALLALIGAIATLLDEAG